MIDRTELDLRVAAHQATAATVNAHEWQRQGASSRRPIRAVVAAALIALAARLAPEPITLPAIRRAARPDASA